MVLDKNGALPILVWPYDEAPEQLRNLSPHGGDEDWVAHVPVHFASLWIPWLDSGGSFGCCDVSKHELSDGSVVFIGAHS